MSPKNLLKAGCAALCMLCAPAVVSATPASPNTIERWEAETAMERARGALDKAQRHNAMKYEFFVTKDAWDAFREAQAAHASGDYEIAELRALQATRLAEKASYRAQDNVADRWIEEQKRQLMTEVVAAADVTPIITEDGIELTFEHLFIPTTANLSEKGHEAIELMAETAQRYPHFRIRVEGYAPQSTENETLALTIAQRRAVELVNALEAWGIESSRLTSTRNDEPYSMTENGADFVFVDPQLAVR